MTQACFQSIVGYSLETLLRLKGWLLGMGWIALWVGVRVCGTSR